MTILKVKKALEEQINLSLVEDGNDVDVWTEDDILLTITATGTLRIWNTDEFSINKIVHTDIHGEKQETIL